MGKSFTVPESFVASERWKVTIAQSTACMSVDVACGTVQAYGKHHRVIITPSETSIIRNSNTSH